MSKTIKINDVSLQDFHVSRRNNKLHVRVTYSLLDAQGLEYFTTTDSMNDNDLTDNQKTFINNIISAIESKMKQREKIN